VTSTEYIPARLRSAFREHARGIVMHDIERIWQDEGFAPGIGQVFSGSRMSLWSDFESSVQWWNWDHTVRVMRVYEECIIDAELEYREKLVQQLARNGFRFTDADKIEYVGATNRITEVTRTRVLDFLRTNTGGTRWSGRFEEADFLKRLYNLTAIPSDDPRFPDAQGDILQHRVNNEDWDDDWVFHDPRFELSSGTDGMLLRFLAEMLHPAARTDPTEVTILLSGLNDVLAPDSYELHEKATISGRPLFGWRTRRGFHGSSPNHLLQNRPGMPNPFMGQVLHRPVRRIKPFRPVIHSIVFRQVDPAYACRGRSC